MTITAKTIVKNLLNWSVLAIAAAFTPGAFALDLVESYQRARTYDPQFQGAVAEREANQSGAAQARTAYYPEANFSRTQVQTQSTPVQTITISQPLLSMDRFATYKQSAPRSELASATFQTREQELAQRVLKSVTDLIRAKEAAVLNEAKISNFERQSARAKRLFELGQGTITDLRDIQVKYEQAKANQISLMVAQQSAQRVFTSLTGIVPTPKDFLLPTTHSSFPMAGLDQFKTQLEQNNPQLLASRQSERISELEAQRVKGSMYPTVSMAMSRSTSGGNTFSNTGFTLSLPLNAGNYYSSSTAAANAVRAKEDRRFAEEKARVELDRLYGLVAATQDAIKIKRSAIESAELSVEANQKSYDAGVRSNIDVVNSIQVLFEVKNDYVQAVTTQAENYMSLLMLAGRDPAPALGDTDKFMLGQR